MALSYTNTLTNGTTADASAVMQNFNDAKTVIDSNTSGISALQSAAFSNWATIFTAGKTMKYTSITGSGKVILGAPFSGQQSAGPYYLGDDQGWENAVFYLPSVNSVSGKTAQWRVILTVLSGGTSPGVSVTVNVDTIGSPSTTSGYLMAGSLTTNLSGPTQAIGASSNLTTLGTAGTATPGQCVLSASVTGAMNSGSTMLLKAAVQFTYV